MQLHRHQIVYKKSNNIRKIGLSLALAAVAVSATSSGTPALPRSGVGPIDAEMDASFCEETFADMLALRERYRMKEIRKSWRQEQRRGEKLERIEEQLNEASKSEQSEQQPVQKRQAKIINKPIVRQQWPLVIQLEDGSDLRLYTPLGNLPREYAINKIHRKIANNPRQQLHRFSARSYLAIVEMEKQIRKGVLFMTSEPINEMEGSIYFSGREIFTLEELFDVLKEVRESTPRTLGSARISFPNHCAFFKIDFDLGVVDDASFR